MLHRLAMPRAPREIRNRHAHNTEDAVGIRIFRVGLVLLTVAIVSVFVFARKVLLLARRNFAPSCHLLRSRLPPSSARQASTLVSSCEDSWEQNMRRLEETCMRSARIRAALALLLLMLCALAFGEPAVAYAGAGAEPSGRLELTVLSGAEDVCAKCTVMATNTSTGHTGACKDCGQ
jgi:hypothetical protein